MKVDWKNIFTMLGVIAEGINHWFPMIPNGFGTGAALIFRAIADFIHPDQPANP